MISRIYLGAPKAAPPVGSIQALERELASKTGGFTAFAGLGTWLGPEGIVEEMAFVYEIVHDQNASVAAVREFALAMKKLLNQQEVLMVHIQAEKEAL